LPPYPVLAGVQLVRHRAERRSQRRIGILCGERLRPVQRQVERAAAVVYLACLARRLAPVAEVVRGRAVESISEQARARIIELLSEMLKRGGEGHVLAERVPAEVALSLELLYVLRRRAAGSCLEQSAAVQQRYDGQHACAGADLEDRKQVGEIVAQYVAR